MSRETLGGYIPPEELKRKKRETETELVEMVIESASLSAAAPGLNLDKMTTSVEILSHGINPALSAKIAVVKKTEEYARMYETVLDKAHGSIEKDKKAKRAKSLKI